MNGIEIFNRVINQNVIQNTKFLAGRKNYLMSFPKLTSQLKKQERIRTQLLKNEDVTVPPILIISITNDCNLTCSGCYACKQDRLKNDEMTIEDIDRIIGEGIDLGVGFVFIAGGEPLVKEGILDVIKKYDRTIFVMFSNGMLIDDEMIVKMKQMKNLVTAFSLEGNEKSTDNRRGSGVFSQVVNTMEKMDKEKILFGTSITVTRNNYDEVTSDKYLSELEAKGCRVIFLIEYVPCNDDKKLCLTEEQKSDLLVKIEDIEEKYNMFPIPLPGDEAYFGGCLAAGRGFLHISSTGSVEACPFAPYSDMNVKNVSLKIALKSKLLATVRDNHHMLEESEGGCALYENNEWVESLLSS